MSMNNIIFRTLGNVMIEQSFPSSNFGHIRQLTLVHCALSYGLDEQNSSFPGPGLKTILIGVMGSPGLLANFMMLSDTCSVI